MGRKKAIRNDGPNIRKFPYPFQAALAITNDLDETDSADAYQRIQSFMNRQIGLEFTNTFYPFHKKGMFSLLSSGEGNKKIIINNIKNGLIDAIHSYGEISDFERKDAVRVLDVLNKNGCALEVWIDHADSPGNLCKYRRNGRGDVLGAKEYHYDLTPQMGVKFIWTERLTNIIGQGTGLNISCFTSIFDRRYPKKTAEHMLKSILKVVLDILGYQKYNYFKENKLIQETTMADGQKVYEFIRFNNHYEGAAVGDTFEDLHYLISDKVLRRLKEVSGYMVVYIHLGKKFNTQTVNGEKTVVALENLKRENKKGNIYVSKVGPLLRYYLVRQYLDWEFEKNGRGNLNIYIKQVNDPIRGPYIPTLKDLNNITFNVPDARRTSLFISNQEIRDYKINPPEPNRLESLTIKA